MKTKFAMLRVRQSTKDVFDKIFKRYKSTPLGKKPNGLDVSDVEIMDRIADFIKDKLFLKG